MVLVIEIKVIPSSGKQKIFIDKSGQLKCYLKNPPEKGKANDELLRYIANIMNILRDEIEILSGLAARKKRIKINKNITYTDFLKIVGIDSQLTLN